MNKVTLAIISVLSILLRAEPPGRSAPPGAAAALQNPHRRPPGFSDSPRWQLPEPQYHHQWWQTPAPP